VRDLASHPLRLYYNLGLRVTVNTDNRLITDTTVSQELWHCYTQMGMSLSDVKSILVAGFKSAFLPFHVKQAYLRRVTDELDRFQADGVIRPASGPSSIKGGARGSSAPGPVSEG
jgi:adenosine deaminase